jgi:hypothetical protein
MPHLLIILYIDFKSKSSHVMDHSFFQGNWNGRDK